MFNYQESILLEDVYFNKKKNSVMWLSEDGGDNHATRLTFQSEEVLPPLPLMGLHGVGLLYCFYDTHYCQFRTFFFMSRITKPSSVRQ